MVSCNSVFTNISCKHWQVTRAHELRTGRLNGFESLLPPHLSDVRIGELSPTISFTFHNNPTRARFTQWLSSCAEVRKQPVFDLLFEPSFFPSLLDYLWLFSCEQPDKRLSGETLKKAGKSAASLDMSDVTFSLMPFIFTTWSGYNLLMIYWVFFLCLWICLDETRVHMCWQEAVCAACMQAFTPCHALSPKVHESDGRRQGDRERRGEGWRSGGATP